MARIMAIAMQKGGVGKTTTAINLAAGLAALDFRVLAIDLDPQGNLTQHVGFDPEKQSPTIYDALKAEVNGQSGKVSSAICKSKEGFDLLPSQPELSLIELSLMNTLSRERVLSTVLEEIDDLYDFVLIDCSPSLNLLVVNALTASDSVIIPIQTEYLPARGALMVLSTIETIRRKKLNQELEVEGILLTMADTRTIMTKEILAAVEQQYSHGQYVFKAFIKRSIRFAESAVAGQSILAYDPSNPGAEAYRQVASEIVEKESRRAEQAASNSEEVPSHG